MPEIAKIGPPWVGSVEDGVHDAYRFLRRAAALYADKAKLAEARDDIDARWKYEVAKAADLLLDDSEPPPALDAKKIRERLGIKEEDSSATPTATTSRRTARRWSSPSAPRSSGTDLEKGDRGHPPRDARRCERVNPTSFDPAITWGLAGDLKSGITEYGAVNKDLTDVGQPRHPAHRGRRSSSTTSASARSSPCCSRSASAWRGPSA